MALLPRGRAAKLPKNGLKIFKDSAPTQTMIDAPDAGALAPPTQNIALSLSQTNSVTALALSHLRPDE
ncbi:hypothetical protein CK218_01320 [Mesorhizobium sp. WSM3879]|nr:hypothetical protein CK218_01320 [Mesorhizobium sp. WSM3879]